MTGDYHPPHAGVLWEGRDETPLPDPIAAEKKHSEVQYTFCEVESDAINEKAVTHNYYHFSVKCQFEHFWAQQRI